MIFIGSRTKLALLLAHHVLKWRKIVNVPCCLDPSFVQLDDERKTSLSDIFILKHRQI